MAKIKVKQIEDLSLANSLLTVGAGQVEFSGVPETGGYVSGFGVDENGVIKPIFAALPAEHAIGTGLSEATVEGIRTISLNDVYVRTTVIGLADTVNAGGENNTFVTGITYDQESGKFAYTTGTTVAAKDGKLFIKFGNGAATDTGFSANAGSDQTISFAAVAGSGAAADVTVAAGITGLEATNVQAALAELAGDIAAIDQSITTVTAGKGIKVTDSAAEGSNDHTYTVEVNFTVDTIKYGEDAGVDKAGKTYIRIMDGETVISETDAAAFVKDGFLTSVTKDSDNNELVFTWNTDSGAGQSNQVTRIAISDLCDVYTADETYLHLENYKFSHKTQTGLPTSAVGATADATADAAGESVEFKVPSITVDAAGHVTAASEKTIKVAIPEAPATTNTTIVVTEIRRAAVEGLVEIAATLGEGEEMGTICGYLNGQLLPEGSVSYANAEGKFTFTTPTYDDVNIEAGDRVEVVYDVKKSISFTTLA